VTARKPDWLLITLMCLSALTFGALIVLMARAEKPPKEKGKAGVAKLKHPKPKNDGGRNTRSFTKKASSKTRRILNAGLAEDASVLQARLEVRQAGQKQPLRWFDVRVAGKGNPALKRCLGLIERLRTDVERNPRNPRNPRDPRPGKLKLSRTCHADPLPPAPTTGPEIWLARFEGSTDPVELTLAALRPDEPQASMAKALIQALAERQLEARASLLKFQPYPDRDACRRAIQDAGLWAGSDLQNKLERASAMARGMEISSCTPKGAKSAVCDRHRRLANALAEIKAAKTPKRTRARCIQLSSKP
jgi:hypothetical protein